MFQNLSLDNGIVDFTTLFLYFSIFLELSVIFFGGGRPVGS